MCYQVSEGEVVCYQVSEGEVGVDRLAGHHAAQLHDALTQRLVTSAV